MCGASMREASSTSARGATSLACPASLHPPLTVGDEIMAWPNLREATHSELTTTSLWYICSLLNGIYEILTHNREYGCQALPDARHGPPWHHANTDRTRQGQQLRLACLLYHCMYRRSRLGMLKRFSMDTGRFW